MEGNHHDVINAFKASLFILDHQNHIDAPKRQMTKTIPLTKRIKHYTATNLTSADLVSS